MHDYLAQADIGTKSSCHIFRNTIVALMKENGVDIRYIQQILGHVSLDTTQLYTRISIRTLKNVHMLTKLLL